MHPKINENQHLGPPFKITGPVDDAAAGSGNDDDLAMAITFVITQRQGRVVAKGVGKGDAVYTQGDKGGQWAGSVKVQGTPAFQAGPAHIAAFAAIVTDEGEWELYPWGRDVKLS